MAVQIPPSLAQLQANCGVYAMWMIFQHHGLDKDIDELVQLSGHDYEEGTFTIALAVALKKLGFDVSFYSDVDPQMDEKEIPLYAEAQELGISIQAALRYSEIQNAVQQQKFVIVYYDSLEGVGNQSLIYSIDDCEICFFDSFEAMPAQVFEQQRKVEGICRQAIVIDDRNFHIRSTRIN